MQTAWIWMRHRVTQRLIQIQAIWHSDNVFINFKPHWNTLKIEEGEQFADDNVFGRQRVELTTEPEPNRTVLKKNLLQYFKINRNRFKLFWYI